MKASEAKEIVNRVKEKERLESEKASKKREKLASKNYKKGLSDGKKTGVKVILEKVREVSERGGDSLNESSPSRDSMDAWTRGYWEGIAIELRKLGYEVTCEGANDFSCNADGYPRDDTRYWMKLKVSW